jgi:KAP family P-loop domain
VSVIRALEQEHVDVQRRVVKQAPDKAAVEGCESRRRKRRDFLDTTSTRRGSLVVATITGSTRTTVFRAFERADFLDWPSWGRLREILRSNGGSYGVSGPRGAGKSWLMLRAIDDVRASGDVRGGGIGLWYPSPSEYDSLAFLASLADGLANEIERRFRREHPLRDAIRWKWIGSLVIPAIVGLVVYALLRINLASAELGRGPFGFLTVEYGPGAISAAAAAVAIALSIAAALAVALGTRLWVAWRSVRRPEERLLREAALVRERARYSSTRRDASEFGTEAGRGIVARARTSRERELVERPATLSSLVNDFRALAAQAGEVTGRVVIAIDELDKMAEAEKVRALLRDIKGIFDVPRVHFLVSVSDEAARSLKLGALTGRNEFNSSFYTVIEVPPATPDQSAALLVSRAGTREDVGVALGILAGGNPREVLRLAEFAGVAETPAEAAVRVLREEALNLRRDIVTAENSEGEPDFGEVARLESFKSLPDDDFDSIDRFSKLADRALAAGMWMPDWRDGGWEVLFGEPWRRLMIRLAVAGEIVAKAESLVANPTLGLQLQDVITASSQSAAVARVVLEQRLRVGPRSLKEAAVSA